MAVPHLGVVRVYVNDAWRIQNFELEPTPGFEPGTFSSFWRSPEQIIRFHRRLV